MQLSKIISSKTRLWEWVEWCTITINTINLAKSWLVSKKDCLRRLPSWIDTLMTSLWRREGASQPSTKARQNRSCSTCSSILRSMTWSAWQVAQLPQMRHPPWWIRRQNRSKGSSSLRQLRSKISTPNSRTSLWTNLSQSWTNLGSIRHMTPSRSKFHKRTSF